MLNSYEQQQQKEEKHLFYIVKHIKEEYIKIG